MMRQSVIMTDQSLNNCRWAAHSEFVICPLLYTQIACQISLICTIPELLFQHLDQVLSAAKLYN